MINYLRRALKVWLPMLGIILYVGITAAITMWVGEYSVLLGVMTIFVLSSLGSALAIAAREY